MTTDTRSTRNDTAKVSRAVLDDRAHTENRTLTDASRLEQFRRAYEQPALANLPEIPGYRTCWVSTESQGDSPHRRMEIGWEFVTAADLPGWDTHRIASMRSAAFEGVIGIKEMVAMKLPTELRAAYMKEVHHTAPGEQDQSLKDRERELTESMQRMNRNARVIPGEQVYSEDADHLPDLSERKLSFT